jgi:hypothetical protein
MENNFNKYTNSFVDTQNSPYDYGSVMHYERDAFTSNGLPTIEPIESGAQIGQRIGMSPIDIEEVRLFYNCSSNGIISSTIPTITGLKKNLYKLIKIFKLILNYFYSLNIYRKNQNLNNFYLNYRNKLFFYSVSDRYNYKNHFSF